MKNLSHSASFHSKEKIAPAKSGIKHLLRSRSTSVCQAKHLNLHAHSPKPTHEPLTEDYRVMIYTATIILTDRQETKVPASVAPTWAA